MNVLGSLHDGKKKIAILIDPDTYEEYSFGKLLEMAQNKGVSYLFVGGSLLHQNHFQHTVQALKSQTNMPVVVFPGSAFQVSPHADAILFLSLVSGRNPDYLISQQVAAAPAVAQAKLEVIPTAYLLIDGGTVSTAAYITQTIPIPANKVEIAATTALAAAYLGMKTIYLEAGSGAKLPVSHHMISAVKNTVSLPLIVGGGINSADKIQQAFDAGADVVVIGNALENNPELLHELLT
jgi:putative glycerol-1-phosphate prenyltransferase